MARPTKLDRLKNQARQKDERRAAVRADLVRSALQTLSELGYSQTGLRDIAEQAGRSVGVVHYYFDDKADLIIACVRLYKADFIDAMEGWVAPDLPQAELQDRFVEGLVGTIREEAPLHRLWYDIRSEAMFDARFREPVQAIEAALIDTLQMVTERLGLPPEQAVQAYVSLDGAFRYALSGFLDERPDALDELRVNCRATLEYLQQR